MSLGEQIVYEPESAAIATIANGADLNAIDRFGFRPLIQAVICNKFQVLHSLIEHGADLEQLDILGRTPLQWASDRGNYEFCKILLEHGANPNHYSADGQPILVNPILREQLELVDLLVKYQANYQFAQDFISAKLLGHRYELVGEVDIVAPSGKFIALSYEGFYLEFSTGLLRRSLNNFINSIPGQKHKKQHGRLNRIVAALKNAEQLTSFSKHKDKTPFSDTIDSILDSKLLLLPAGYQGHAITFIQLNNLWAKCDRGVNDLVDTVVVYEIGNPYALNKEFYHKILYGSKDEKFVTRGIKQELKLKTICSLPTSQQVTGNCSWANVETSVPTMLFMLNIRSNDYDHHSMSFLKKDVYKLYNDWVQWDQDSALDETIDDFSNVDLPRQISKAMILGCILTQRCMPNNKYHIARAKKILTILTQPNFQFILKNYRNLFTRDVSGSIGKEVMQLFNECKLDLRKLELESNTDFEGTKHAENIIKMTTALHVACLSGELDSVKYLVEKLKIDVNYLDRTGSTALMYAAWQGHTKVVRYLVNNCDADPSIKNFKGGTAAQYAKHSGYDKLADFLIYGDEGGL